MTNKTKKSDKNSRKPISVNIPGRRPTTMPLAEVLQIAQRYLQQQQWALVMQLMQQVTEQAGNHMGAWLIWLESCDKAKDFGQMETVSNKCLQIKARYVPALIARATALRMQQRHSEALKDIEKAIKLEPGNAKILNHLGILQKELGENDAALATFNRCIAIQPTNTKAYWNRSDLLTSPSVQQIYQMQQCLQQKGMSQEQQARLHYSLAKAYEYLGDAEQQINNIELGAKFKRGAVIYDHTAEMQQMQRIPHSFTTEILSQSIPVTNTSATPVFICGLPRSGSTLAEQILSSHPEVIAGDELSALPLATSQCLRVSRIEKPFPEWASDLQTDDWRSIGRLYLEHTRALQQKAFFTDKNLQNYKAIGLIHLALPQAKIIYCRREPMDNLWGCYRQLFGDGLYFTYDQKELAQTWNAAEALLGYWHQQLNGKLFIMDYEKLVDDQERVTRSLLEFVGLDWNEDCLKFYENPRAVSTISSVQVRSPISKDRIGKWRIFEDRLHEMKTNLSNNNREPSK